MKVKNTVIVRELDGEFVAVDTGIGKDRFSGMIRMNKTGAFVLDCLAEETDTDAIVRKMTERYDVDEETARENVLRVAEALRGAGLLVE